MSRFSRYDTDEERLPEGMTRIGYDADTETYTFQDADGSLWESAPGCQYGKLTRVGRVAHPDDDNDASPFLTPDSPYSRRSSWRAELMPLLNFGILIGLSLLLLFWYLHVAAAPSKKQGEIIPELWCPEDYSPYTVKKGDSCWDLARERAITVDEIVNVNEGLDCDKLPSGLKICLPAVPSMADTANSPDAH